MAAGLSGLGRGSSAAATAEGPGTTATCGTTTILPSVDSDNIVQAGCSSDDEVTFGERLNVEVDWRNETGVDIVFNTVFGIQMGDGDVQWIHTVEGTEADAGETVSASQGIDTTRIDGIDDIDSDVDVTPHVNAVEAQAQ